MIAFSSTLSAQGEVALTRNRYYERVTKFAEQLRKVVFAVELISNKANSQVAPQFIPIGTGFYLERLGKLYGVTCAHVVRGHPEESLRIRILADSGFLRVPISIAVLDTAHDVAILEVLNPLASPLTVQNITPRDTYLADSSIIIPGRELVILGFPLGIGAKYDENEPVVSTGMVAQYASSTSFLIDGTINMGNSGSPVWSIYDEKIIGMIEGFQNASIPLFDSQGRQVAGLPYNSGLANGIPSFVIKKILSKVN